jgi:hypothetical protein
MVETLLNRQLNGMVLRNPSRRWFIWALSLSLLAHVVLTPLPAALGVLTSLLGRADTAADPPVEQLRTIPITWLGDDTESDWGAPASEPGLEPQPVAAPALDAETRVAPVKEPVAPTTAKPPTSKPDQEERKPRERGAVAHPVALSGMDSKIVDDNANVNLLLVSERIREHPLGDRIGRLMVNFPQWRSFLGSTAIDPIRDIDRLLLVGPQFRRSADVVAVLHHSLRPEVVRQAVDQLVKRPPRGRWLKGKVPVALAYADRAQRLFAFTAPDMIVIAPPHLERQLLEAPPTRFPPPAGGEALVVHIKTPWRALIGLPFDLPQSIAWLRLDVLPLEDGGAKLRFTAEDQDASLALEHARVLTLALNAVTNPDLGSLGALLGVRTISCNDRVNLDANGNRLSV